MPQVARIVIHDIDDVAELSEALGRSLPDGTKVIHSGSKIYVATIPEALRYAVSQWVRDAEQKLDK